MTTPQTRDPVLRRKIAPRSRDPDEPPVAQRPDGPARDIARSFARSVSLAAPLVAENGQRSVARLSLAELLDAQDPDSFFGLARGGFDAPPGLIVMDQAGFVALVEAMTVGRLSARAPAPRRATATDAALVSSVIDAALSALEPDDPDSTLRIDRHVADPRLLPVLLEDTRYVRVSLSVGLVSGDLERRAQLQIAFPVAMVSQAAAPPQRDDPAKAAPDTGWSEALERAVLRAPASLRAELGRVTMPLSEVMTLGVGGALTLPLSVLEEVRLVSLDGTEQAVGRLGQSRGMRAIRLTAMPGGHGAVYTEARAPSQTAESPAQDGQVPHIKAVTAGPSSA